MSVWLAVRAAMAVVLLWLTWNVHSNRDIWWRTAAFKFVAAVPALYLTGSVVIEIARIAAEVAS